MYDILRKWNIILMILILINWTIRADIDTIRSMNRNNTNIVWRNNKESEEFISEIGVKQKYILNPLMFSVVTDETIKKAKRNRLN